MKIPYSKMEKLFAENKTNAHKVAVELGFSKSTFPRWKAGISVPKYNKIKEIADYFGVDLLYFYEDMQSVKGEQESYIKGLDKETLAAAEMVMGNYYADPEVQMITQELHDRPEMRGLFSAARNLDANQMKKAVAIIEAYAKEDDDEV